MSHRPAVVLVALLTMTAGCATAPTVPPTWARTPDPQALADAYPGFAEDAGIEGAAEIECRVSEARLEACEVKSEKPAGLGFGAAALSLSGQYLVQARFARRASALCVVHGQIRLAASRTAGALAGS